MVIPKPPGADFYPRAIKKNSSSYPPLFSMFRGIEDDPYQQRRDRAGRHGGSGGGPTGHSTNRKQYYEQSSQQLDRTKNMFEQNMSRAMDAAFDHMHNGMGSMAWDGHRKEHGETYYVEESFEVRAWSGGAGPMGQGSRRRDMRDAYEDDRDGRMPPNARHDGRSRYNERPAQYLPPPTGNLPPPKSSSRGGKQKVIMPPADTHPERSVSRAGSTSSRIDHPTRVEMPPSPPASVVGNTNRQAPIRSQLLPNLDEYNGLNDRQVARSSHRSREDARYYDYSDSEEDEDPRYYNPEHQYARRPQYPHRVRRMENYPERRLDLYGYPPY